MDDDIGFAEPLEAKPAILLVEDSDPDQVLIEQKVTTLWPECTFVSVKSVAEAYAAFKKETFDLVLLDLNLEDTLGPITVQQIRQFNRTIPIIVITGMLNSITAHESLRMGANNVFSKSQISESDDFFNILEQNIFRR